MKTIEINDLEKIETIISEASVCYIGLSDESGTPYVFPMNFGYKDGIFYLHSGRNGRKIKILQKNPKVCLNINVENKLIWQHPDVACSYSMRSKSLIIEGNVEFIDDFNKKIELLNVIMQHYTNRDFTYSVPAINNVLIWKITPEKISCRAFGQSAKKRYQE